MEEAHEDNTRINDITVRNAAVVVGQLLAAHIEVSGGVGAPDLDIVAVSLGQFGTIQLLGIKGSATEIVAAQSRAT